MWPPIQWELGVNLPGREADAIPLSSAEVKNAWNCVFTPQYVFIAWYSIYLIAGPKEADERGSGGAECPEGLEYHKQGTSIMCKCFRSESISKHNINKLLR
jgi:hypothetical protein